MGHTNSTVNYNLPQFVGTDKPSWLGDVNGAFLAIDTAIAAAKAQADSAAGGVAGLQTVVGGHTTQIGTLTDTVTAQGGTLNSVTALIGNGTPTTTDQTIIGAINELASIAEAGSVEVTGNGVKTASQLCDELYALVDPGKIRPQSVFIQLNGARDTRVHHLNSQTPTELRFARTDPSASKLTSVEFVIKASGSEKNRIDCFIENVISYSNDSADVLTAGYKYIIVY